MLFDFLLLLLVVSSCCAAPPAPILFIIQAQKGTFHSVVAEKTRTSILKQWKLVVPATMMEPPQVLLTTELQEDLVDRAWTYFPLFPFLSQKLEETTEIDWVGVLNENTELNLRGLAEYVQRNQGDLKPREERLFMGKSMQDETSTIVHHFHEATSIKYPDPEPGFFLSRQLVLDLKLTQPAEPMDFHIDPAFELAKFLQEELEVTLTAVPEVCSREPRKAGQLCVTYPRQSEYRCKKNKDLAGIQSILDSVYVIASTCGKYHGTRVPIVKNTWADLVPNLHFISNELDPSIPTEVLPHTINTETGFCNKTRAMLDRFLEANYPWLLIVDDDTVFSPVRFAQLISCYDFTEPTILGQRYGYMVAGGRGYNYITGGGGKIINREAVKQLMALEDGCSCPAPDTPEDMHIFGICAKRAQISINHSGRMFQARPADYPSAMLAYRKPVSFHKHWQVDPVQVYDEWFRKVDDSLRNFKKTAVKDEL